MIGWVADCPPFSLEANTGVLADGPSGWGGPSKIEWVLGSGPEDGMDPHDLSSWVDGIGMGPTQNGPPGEEHA